MDGCWQPWLVGCAIDWDAWAAIGTLAAVVVALMLSGRDRRDRRRAEAAEARLVATVALIELDAIGLICYAALGRDKPEDRVVALAVNGAVQKRFAEKIAAVKSPWKFARCWDASTCCREPSAASSRRYCHRRIICGGAWR